MKFFLVLFSALIAACSGGSGSTSGSSAQWPTKWCEAQPGMTKDQLTGLMGKPTSASATNLTWTDDHWRFYAFMQPDGTARQLDINAVDLSPAEKKGLQCREARSLESMMAAAKPHPRQIPACTLITDTEMSSIVGSPLHGTASGRSKCVYESATGKIPYVEFSLDYGDGEAGMAGAGFAGSSQPGMTSPYDGIGDKAVAVGPALFIKTGDDLITLVLYGVKDVKTKARQVVDLARSKH